MQAWRWPPSAPHAHGSMHRCLRQRGSCVARHTCNFACSSHLTYRARANHACRAATKLELRGDLVRQVQAQRDAEVHRFLGELSSPRVKAEVAGYLQRLGQGGKAAETRKV